MAKQEKDVNLDEMFGATNREGFGRGFGAVPFGGGTFGTPYGFGTAPFCATGFGDTPGFKGDLKDGRLPHYATTPRSLDIINDYEDEIKKADADTKEDLIGIDIELGRLSAFQGFGAGYSRVKIKEHVANITKRYREVVYTLSAATCILGTALIIEKIRNKK